jgi:hypothetical protein
MAHDTLTACPCGSTEFIIEETTSHLARLEDGRLDVFENDTGGGLGDFIECLHCHARHPEELFRIGDLYA